MIDGDALTLRAGALREYEALAPFHYLRARPATVSRVLVLEDRRERVADRFARLCGEPAAGERGRVAAVLVESYPSLGCALRRAALGERYRGWGDRRASARVINAELRCISRVVVHPQWRGAGLAVRLVRAALATATTRYVEALAAMGRVHPFFERAGMTAYRRWPLPRDQRLRDALRFAGLEPWALASATRMRAALREGDPGHPGEPHAGLLRRELARWARNETTIEQQLARARDELLCEPVYYLWRRGEHDDADERGGGGNRAGAAAGAPDERERDAPGAAGEADGAHRAERAIPAADRAPDAE